MSSNNDVLGGLLGLGLLAAGGYAAYKIGQSNAQREAERRRLAQQNYLFDSYRSQQYAAQAEKRRKLEEAQAVFNEGVDFLQSGDAASAIHRLSRALRQFNAVVPESNTDGNAFRSTAHLLIGKASVSAKDFDAAIDSFNRSIELDDDSAEPFALRGLARAMKGDLGAASSDVDIAVRLDPGNEKLTELRDSLVQLRESASSTASTAPDSFNNTVFSTLHRRAVNQVIETVQEHLAEVAAMLETSGDYEGNVSIGVGLAVSLYVVQDVEAELIKVIANDDGELQLPATVIAYWQEKFARRQTAIFDDAFTGVSRMPRINGDSLRQVIAEMNQHESAIIGLPEFGEVVEDFDYEEQLTAKHVFTVGRMLRLPTESLGDVETALSPLRSNCFRSMLLPG